jgi:hypothetical protein
VHRECWLQVSRKDVAGSFGFWATNLDLGVQSAWAQNNRVDLDVAVGAPMTITFSRLSTPSISDNSCGLTCNAVNLGAHVA